MTSSIIEPTLEQRLAQRIRPKRAPVMYQTWRDLLFLHWEIDPKQIQQTLPDGLTVDTFDGKAYLGVVPFFMQWIRPKYLPAVPRLSFFLETNVRTYVYDRHGTPGVWFYSLDCNQPFAVWAARTFFKLPYFNAKMSAHRDGAGAINYSTYRKGTNQNLASRFRYTRRSQPKSAEIGSLEFFLAERYILFAETHKGLASGQVWHTPYPLCSAEVPVWDANLLALNQFKTPQRPPDLAHFSSGVTVDVFPLALIG